MPIRILQPQVANQIAAGEVIERPASVVKELIENSLDAGATEVRVEIREGGRRLVRVQDNGCGIAAAETELAFQRHATSKLQTLDDLQHLTTLGFRGEALASIAAVAQVSLVTRSRDEEVGTRLRFYTQCTFLSEARELAREPIGVPAGTTFVVEHLFANVPARLKFLKQAATETGHIQQIITRYALAFPERRFSLVCDGRLAFQSSGSGQLRDVVAKAYGLDMARQMLPIGDGVPADDSSVGNGDEDDAGAASATEPAPGGPIAVSGYAGTPSLHRSNRSYITLFVNRRWFQDTTLAYSVIQAYHTLLPAGRYPAALIFIELDPAAVDVNVHPTKAEVRFQDSRAVFSAVQRAVRQALNRHAPIPHFTQAGAGDAGPAITTWQDMLAWSSRREALLGAGRSQPGRPPEPPPPGGDALAGPAMASPLAPPAGVPILRVVGQMGAIYIVAEGPDGMYLVDQHAAHERILYEQMLGQHAGQKLAIQPLLEPLVLDLSPEQAAAVAEDLDLLNAWGIAIEPFGSSSYLVRSIPAVLSRDDPHKALVEICDGLAQSVDVAESAHEARLVTAICKRAAIKGGQVLSLTEMQEMVRQLEASRSPRTCPHGRPTMIYMSTAELARQFGRA